MIGVSRPPVLNCGTTFHLDYGGRDLPSTPSDLLWNLIYLVTKALSDIIEFIGAIQVKLSIYLPTYLSMYLTVCRTTSCFYHLHCTFISKVTTRCLLHGFFDKHLLMHSWCNSNSSRHRHWKNIILQKSDTVPFISLTTLSDINECPLKTVFTPNRCNHSMQKDMMRQYTDYAL